MHKRIIWTLFFAAFILDFIRLQSEKSSKKPIPKKNKIEPPKEEPKQIPTPTQDKEEEDIEENEELKIVNNFSKKNKNKNINLRIEFCQSWSHRGYFNQVKEHLEKNYSNIFVIPSDFPLSATRQFLYYLVTFIQISLVLSAFCIQYIKPYFVGIIPNNYIDWIEGNKMIIGMGGFLIGNMLNNNITNTGAFEIYINERLVWSAVNNDKRVPNIETIIHMIKRYGGKLLRY